jgi:hypothetical protein
MYLALAVMRNGDRRLLKRGIAGTAVVLSAKATNTVIQEGEFAWEAPRVYRYVLRVSIPGKAPYQTDCRICAAGINEGSTVNVAVSRHNRKRVTIDIGQGARGKGARGSGSGRGAGASRPVNSGAHSERIAGREFARCARCPLQWCYLTDDSRVKFALFYPVAVASSAELGTGLIGLGPRALPGHRDCAARAAGPAAVTRAVPAPDRQDHEELG